ncbi:armadillo-type protein [Lentinula raphanica]|uniref:Armadillo-type protein n=1 Tax=Lentinula raphanica TaxID=153919 RepID=A0AA38PLN6_9AGAR|nr:armadillo-type protein [Lentinula raphanica]
MGSPANANRRGTVRSLSERFDKYTEHSGQEVDAADFDYEDDNDSPASTVGSGEGGFKLERPGLLKLNSRLSNRSWAAVEDDSSDEDVFAEFDEPFAEDDLEAHIQRDKQARLSARVNTLIDDLSFNANSTGTLLINSTGLNILVASPEMQIQLVSSHGMLAILEVLEGYHSREIVLQLLRIVNLLVTENVSFLESFCLVGGIPVVMGFTSKRFPSECRLEASNFIRLLCHTSVLTLQMFISCRGLKVLVELLDEDCSSATQAPLVVHALNGISSVFDLQSPTTKNDFCRMFVREGLLDPLSGALLNVMANSGMKEKIIRILLVFSQVSQSDSYVRHAVGTRKVIRRLLRACELLEPGCLVLMLKAVKHLSMNVSLLDVLQNANAIEILVRILEEQASSPHSTEMSNHIFQTCFNLCRLNKSRQDEAAQAGIIPCLQRVAETQSPLKQFALPILCDMASAGKSCRMLLWQHNGLNMYLRLLEDPYFQVSALESILSWLQDEPARVEDELMKPDAMRAILDCFVTAKANSFENLLELFLKLTRISTRITTAFSRSTAFFRKVADRLGHNTKPVMRLNLLRILKSVCDAHPNRGILVERYGSGDGLLGVLEGLSRGGGDGAVLVRELAKEIIPVLRPGLKPLPVGSRTGGKGVTPKRMRRTASETSAVTVGVAVGGSILTSAKTPPSSNGAPKVMSTRPKTRLKDISWQGTQ